MEPKTDLHQWSKEYYKINQWRFMQPQCQMVESNKNMKKNSSKIEENSGEERQNENWNKRQVWTKNLTQTKRMDAPKAWMALDTNWWTSLV